MFNYDIKILNDDEKTIFNNYFDQYNDTQWIKSRGIKITNFPILYIENIQINIDNLKNCNDIYHLYTKRIKPTMFELFNKKDYSCKKLYKFSNGRFRWTTIMDNSIVENVIHNKIKQLFQDKFTILYHIFAQHYNIYLPELSKYIFLLYFNIIYN